MKWRLSITSSLDGATAGTPLPKPTTPVKKGTGNGSTVTKKSGNGVVKATAGGGGKGRRPTKKSGNGVAKATGGPLNGIRGWAETMRTRVGRVVVETGHRCPYQRHHSCHRQQRYPKLSNIHTRPYETQDEDVYTVSPPEPEVWRG